MNGRSRPHTTVLAFLLLVAVHRVPAQASSNVGLPAIAALGVQAGAAQVERHAHGVELGGIIDLGWLRSPRLRLQAEVQFMRAVVTQFVTDTVSTGAGPFAAVTLADSEPSYGRGGVVSGPFFDLTGSVAALWLMGNDRQHFVPYLTAGVGVHALASDFGVLALDSLYNANPFGVHVGIGMRLWVASAGRSGLFIEGRRTIAENVNATSIRMGALLFYHDLVRPRKP